MVDLSELNPEQHEAATHINGPMLILAGAGSGKMDIWSNRTCGSEAKRQSEAAT
jgi:hypothetical protein